jgi:multisubunit Na+/H+ antiporter MnhB subunit
MGRCVYCHSVVTKDEDYCYVCGDNVPQRTKAAAKRQPVSALTNLVFLASLGFTFYCFFAAHKLSLTTTLVISSALLLIRILAERLANKNSD